MKRFHPYPHHQQKIPSMDELANLKQHETQTQSYSQQSVICLDDFQIPVCSKGGSQYSQICGRNGAQQQNTRRDCVVHASGHVGSRDHEPSLVSKGRSLCRYF